MYMHRVSQARITDHGRARMHWC